jgi:hypothetical protein
MPAAGFFKRLKLFADKVMNATSSVNKFYKQVEPFISPILDAVPYGSVVKQGANMISRGIDTVDKIRDNVKQNKVGYTSTPRKTLPNNNLIFGEPINKPNNYQKIPLDETDEDEEDIPDE